jgi:hypothetical protein
MKAPFWCYDLFENPQNGLQRQLNPPNQAVFLLGLFFAEASMPIVEAFRRAVAGESARYLQTHIG